MNTLQRLQSPTPPYFRRLRNIGLVLTAISASLLAQPMALPAIVNQIAGYLAVAGSVAAAVSQAVTSEWEQ